MEEHALILQHISEGNQKAFRKLYALYSAKVYNTAISYVQSVQDAEEITQDVFTTIFRKASQFEGKSTVSTWIYRITVNRSLNFIDKRKRSASEEFNPQKMDSHSFDHPGIQLENKENASLLFKVIDTLAPNQKTAFILSYVEELPRQEVADIMDISLKATESLLMRAKTNLREKLEKVYPERRKSK